MITSKKLFLSLILIITLCLTQESKATEQELDKIVQKSGLTKALYKIENEFNRFKTIDLKNDPNQKMKEYEDSIIQQLNSFREIFNKELTTAATQFFKLGGKKKDFIAICQITFLADHQLFCYHNFTNFKKVTAFLILSHFILKKLHKNQLINIHDFNLVENTVIHFFEKLNLLKQGISDDAFASAFKHELEQSIQHPHTFQNGDDLTILKDLHEVLRRHLNR